MQDNRKLAVKISVITVCRNAEKVIRKTIESVIQQTYDDIEYLIIDGNSTDKTKEYIDIYVSKYDIKYISEEDGGIYDAMNKGIRMAQGDFLYFLNAGDYFYNKNVIKDVVSFIKKMKADIYYGDIMYTYPNGEKAVRTYGNICGTRLYYSTGDSINHQAVFAAKECFEIKNFDLSYKICADRKWMMQMHKSGCKYMAMHQLIAVYSLDEESASIANEKLYKEEAERCVKENFRSLYPIFWCMEEIRGNKILSKLLHTTYKFIFMKHGGNK